MQLICVLLMQLQKSLFVIMAIFSRRAVIDGEEEIVFLLSGSDMKIHLYREVTSFLSHGKYIYTER